MHADDVAKALNSPLNRMIITLLCDHDMTAVELFRRLGERAPTYRQSVNKALESLKQKGLVRKYYDDNSKELYYSIIRKKITINLENMEIE